jgi:thiamine-phosphate pyrophosphorylase
LEEFVVYKDMIAITNRHLVGDESEYLEQVAFVASLHPTAIVLREKDLTEEEYIRLAGKVLRICEEQGTELYLHKFLRAAEVLDHRKIHLPFGDLERLGPQPEGYRYGTSVHSAADAARAQQLGVSWMFAGNVYETDCKKGLPGRGLDFLAEVCRESRVSVYGIGGINPERLPEVMRAGAAGGCMMSGFMKMERK